MSWGLQQLPLFTFYKGKKRQRARHITFSLHDPKNIYLSWYLNIFLSIVVAGVLLKLKPASLKWQGRLKCTEEPKLPVLNSKSSVTKLYCSTSWPFNKEKELQSHNMIRNTACGIHTSIIRNINSPLHKHICTKRNFFHTKKPGQRHDNGNDYVRAGSNKYV